MACQGREQVLRMENKRGSMGTIHAYRFGVYHDQKVQSGNHAQVEDTRSQSEVASGELGACPSKTGEAYGL